MKVEQIHKALMEEHADGWLLYDFRGSNSIARRLAEIGDKIATRRWFYFIPSHGEPVKIVHAIEAGTLDHLPGKKLIFRSRQDLRAQLESVLSGLEQVLMEYSPQADIPYVSLVDAGTMELVRSTGVEVRSSADLVQLFEAVWNEEQIRSHFEATRLVDEVKNAGFRLITEMLQSNKSISEFDVQQYMWNLFDEKGLTADHPAIVAVNQNASDPHYAPDSRKHTTINKGDLILIDIWGKLRHSDAIYGDITWMGYAGSEVPSRFAEIFTIVRNARMAAFELIRTRFKENKPIYAWEADQAARTYISEKGYGDYFLHRTGHSIGVQVHGNGAHLDNLETRDLRKLIRSTGFSIEPGIYLPEFGVRSEVDVFIGNEGPVITSPEQKEIIPLLSNFNL